MKIRRQILAIIARNQHHGVSPIDLDFSMRNHSVEYKTVLENEILQGAIKVEYVNNDNEIGERYKLNQRERFSDVEPNVIDEQIYRLHQMLQKNPSGTYLSEIASALKIPLEDVQKIVIQEQVNDYIVESNEDSLYVRYHSTLQIDVENLVGSAKISTNMLQRNSSLIPKQFVIGICGLGGLGMLIYYLLQSFF